MQGIAGHGHGTVGAGQVNARAQVIDDQVVHHLAPGGAHANTVGRQGQLGIAADFVVLNVYAGGRSVGQVFYAAGSVVSNQVVGELGRYRACAKAREPNAVAGAADTGAGVGEGGGGAANYVTRNQGAAQGGGGYANVGPAEVARATAASIAKAEDAETAYGFAGVFQAQAHFGAGLALGAYQLYFGAVQGREDHVVGGANDAIDSHPHRAAHAQGRVVAVGNVHGLGRTVNRGVLVRHARQARGGCNHRHTVAVELIGRATAAGGQQTGVSRAVRNHEDAGFDAGYGVGAAVGVGILVHQAVGQGVRVGDELT